MFVRDVRVERSRCRNIFLKPHPATLASTSEMFVVQKEISQEVYTANFHDQVAWDKLKEYEMKLLREVHPHADLFIQSLGGESTDSTIYPSQTPHTTQSAESSQEPHIVGITLKRRFDED